jgi:hypothetical protein
MAGRRGEAVFAAAIEGARPPQLRARTLMRPAGVSPRSQGNPGLTALPRELGQLPKLQQLSAADCALEWVPAELGQAPTLQSLTLYGNRLQEVPPAVLQVGCGYTPPQAGLTSCFPCHPRRFATESPGGFMFLGSLGIGQSQLQALI